eukprot:scaffold82727_cov75-Cyclotella_meneghiniana.AAC.1
MTAQDRPAAGGMKDKLLLMNKGEGREYDAVLLGGITLGASWLFCVGWLAELLLGDNRRQFPVGIIQRIGGASKEQRRA